MKKLLIFTMTALMSFQALAADLKSQDITQWLTSMPILKPWLEKHESELTANISEPNNPEVVFNESIPALKKAGLYDELNTKVKALGYTDVEQWTSTTQQVTFAWMALEMSQKKSQIEAAKSQYEAMIANPDIPASQKVMMEQMMAPALVMVKLANQSSEADKKAVKPHQDKLRAYFDAEQQ